MNNTSIYFTLVALAVCILGCSPQPTEPSENTSDLSETPANIPPATLKVEDTVSLGKYTTWTANWDLHHDGWLDTTDLIGFNMPLIDFREIERETGAKKSRLYLGLKATGSGYEAKMLAVGIDSSNAPMLDYSKGEYAYDLSSACPPYCQPN